jgi:hypothetical protein
MKKRALPKSESIQRSSRFQSYLITYGINGVVTFLNFKVVLQQFTYGIYASTRNIEPRTIISNFRNAEAAD